MHGLQNVLVATHAEVIVGAPDGDSLFLCRRMCARELLGKSIDVVKVTVRLVLVLLVELVVVEFLVIETWGRRRSGLGASVGVGCLDRVLNFLGRWSLKALALGHGRANSGGFTLLSRTEHGGVHAGFLLGRSVQFFLEQRLDDARADGDIAIAAAGIDAGALDSQSLVHDGASSGNELQVGDGAATGRLAGGGGEGAQSGRRGLLQEGADTLGLMEESLHDLGGWSVHRSRG